jgi:flagellar motility protein MotE (MotC chaperone)
VYNTIKKMGKAIELLARRLDVEASEEIFEMQEALADLEKRVEEEKKNLIKRSIPRLY